MALATIPTAYLTARLTVPNTIPHVRRYSRHGHAPPRQHYYSRRLLGPPLEEVHAMLHPSSTLLFLRLLHSSQPKTGAVYMEKGYFLTDTDLQHLDTSFFSVSRAEVELLDPQQRQLLEVVWGRLGNAGETG
jgi:hypothetical protein